MMSSPVATETAAHIEKPGIPDFVRRLRPRGGRVDLIRQRLVRLAHRAAERGWVNSVPMRHVVICGFPRSGTTLLQLMLETAYPDAARFGRERSALFLAQHTWPGRCPLMISKRPNDIFWVDEIRACYKDRTGKPRFIVTTRDPRAVLTSHHPARRGYYVGVDRWRAVFEHVQYVRRFPDVILAEYRELVERPLDLQQVVTGVIGSTPASEFDRFYASVPSGFDSLALNGIRPADRASVHRWRHPRHKERIRELLVAMPELPQRLIELGYEQDEAWVRAYA